ncbi:ATP-binding protein [Pseudoroseicyclus sp. H15]
MTASARQGAASAPYAVDLARLAAFCAWAVMAVALAVAIGWLADLDSLVRLSPNLPSMVPLTAMALALLASAQILQLLQHSLARYAARGLAGAAGAIGLGDLAVVYWGEWMADPTIDRMSLATAVGIVIIALSQLLSGLRMAEDRRLPAIVATAGAILNLIALDGYLFDADALQEVVLFQGLATHTALCLLLLAFAQLLASPQPTWAQFVLSSGRGGKLARRWLPLAVFTPLVACYLALCFTDQGIINANTRLAALSVALAALAGLLVLYGARTEGMAATAVQRQELRLRHTLDSLSNAVFIFSDAEEELALNRKAEELTSRSASPRAWLDAVHFHSLENRELLEGRAHPIQRLLEAGEDEVYAGYMDDDGNERALRLSVTRRISERERLTILAIDDETAGWAIREGLFRAEGRNAVGALSGGVAHEMSNILGIIQLAADTGLMQRSMEGRDRQLTAIRRACGRGTEFTDRLLSLARDNLGGDRTVDVAGLVEDVCTLARQSLPSHIALECEVASGPCPMSCAASDFETMLLNLIINARNAIVESGQATGRIAITIGSEDETIRLTVTDDGPGMEPRVQAMAKDPFFTTRREMGGTGLGLAMIDNFAHKVGGQFNIHSRFGEGVEAVLTAPRALVAPDELEDEGETDDLLGICVLLVEDDPDFRDMLAESLIFLGARVLRAENGPAALAMLQRNTDIDVLMTDISLPYGLNGYALAHEAVRLRPRLPVLYLTGFAETPATGMRPVPGLVLRKPVRLHELPNAVRLALLRH